MSEDPKPPSGSEEPGEELSERVFKRLEELRVLPADLSAPEATVAVLCALSKRLSGDAARELLEAMPSALRQIVRPCAEHRGEHGETLEGQELLKALQQHLHITFGRADSIARAVFTAVRAEMPVETVVDLEDHFPPDLRELWAIRRAA